MKCLKIFWQNAHLALVHKPKTVLAATFLGASAGGLAGALVGGLENGSDADCAAGQWVIDNAPKYNCTTVNGPCSHTGEVARPPLKWDCNGDNIAYNILLEGFKSAYAAYPNNWTRFAISVTVGTLGGALLGFVTSLVYGGRKARAERLTTDRTPLVSRYTAIGGSTAPAPSALQSIVAMEIDEHNNGPRAKRAGNQ